jgi:hypothetical protein
MKVVYATATASVTRPGGHQLLVQKGTHWPADDPLVLSHPDLFSEDARYGMCYSQAPRGEVVEAMTAGPGERRPITARG